MFGALLTARQRFRLARPCRVALGARFVRRAVARLCRQPFCFRSAVAPCRRVSRAACHISNAMRQLSSPDLVVLREPVAGPQAAPRECACSSRARNRAAAPAPARPAARSGAAATAAGGSPQLDRTDRCVASSAACTRRRANRVVVAGQPFCCSDARAAPRARAPRAATRDEQRRRVRSSTPTAGSPPHANCRRRISRRGRGATVPTLIVVHNISLPPNEFGGDAIAETFPEHASTTTPIRTTSALRGVRVSAHFVIHRDGAIEQYVSCNERAWHAGASSFFGRERCNDFSIGIELEGSDAMPSKRRNTTRSHALVDALTSALSGRCARRPSDIAPGRKTDPGPHFDWRRLQRATRSRARVSSPTSSFPNA